MLNYTRRTYSRQARNGLRPLRYTLARIATTVAPSGDFDTAWMYLQEALALCGSETPSPARVWVQHFMARTALKQDHYAVANASLAQSLAIFLELNEQGSLGYCLRDMVEFEFAQRHFEQAACLLGNAIAMAEQYEWPLSRHERAGFATLQSDLQNILEPAVFQQAWARGAAMTLLHAVAFAEGSLANSIETQNLS